jgi:hypothetical protein
MLDLLLIEWVTKMKTGSNSVEDHPQLSHNRHPVDGALVGAGSQWPNFHTLKQSIVFGGHLLPLNPLQKRRGANNAFSTIVRSCLG